MADPKTIRSKLVNQFGEELGAEKFRTALEIRAKEGISLKEAVNRVTHGELSGPSEIQKKIERVNGLPKKISLKGMH